MKPSSSERKIVIAFKEKIYIYCKSNCKDFNLCTFYTGGCIHFTHVLMVILRRFNSLYRFTQVLRFTLYYFMQVQMVIAVKTLDYLIQKLPFDFFEFLNPSKNLFQNFRFLDEELLSVFDELSQSFLNVLDEHFID